MKTGMIELRQKTWVTVEIDGVIEESVTNTRVAEWSDEYLREISYEIQLDWGTGVDLSDLIEWRKDGAQEPLELQGWSESCQENPSYKREVTYFLHFIPR